MKLIVLKHSIYSRDENGRILAEITFPEKEPGIFTIDRIYVAEEYIGSPIPDRLIAAALDQIRREGGKAAADDPYARKYFHEHHLT